MSRVKVDLTDFSSFSNPDGEMGVFNLSWDVNTFQDGNASIALFCQIEYDDDSITRTFPEKFNVGSTNKYYYEGDQLFYDDKAGSIKDKAKTSKNCNYAKIFFPAIMEAVKGTEFEQLFRQALSEGNLAPIKKFYGVCKWVPRIGDDGKVKTTTTVKDGKTYTNEQGDVVPGRIEKLLTKSAVDEKPDDKTLVNALEKAKGLSGAQLKVALLKVRATYLLEDEAELQRLGFVVNNKGVLESV